MKIPPQNTFSLAVGPSLVDPAGAPAPFDCATLSVPNLPRMATSQLSCCSFSPSILVMEALHALPGVRQVDVDERAGRVTVVYDYRLVNTETLSEALGEAGFPASV
ncbi:MAG: heavy-metal-associated domain-containing protein [Chloroflexi bacterium]|nr:heavy-metal-associated domain-containing protein [Chloroflexota bacterium]